MKQTFSKNITVVLMTLLTVIVMISACSQGVKKEEAKTDESQAKTAMQGNNSNATTGNGSTQPSSAMTSPMDNSNMSNSNMGGSAMGNSNDTGMKVNTTMADNNQYGAENYTYTLSILDRKTNKTETKEVKFFTPSTVKVGDVEYVVTINKFLPNFVITDNGIASRDEKLDNPAIYISVMTGGKPLYENWIFKNFPEVHNDETSPISITFTNIK